MIDKYAIKFSSRREALRELCKYPGNQVLEQDGTYYLQISNYPFPNVERREIRGTLWGRILPKWIPVIILKRLGIRTLHLWQISLENVIVYLNLGNYQKKLEDISLGKKLFRFRQSFFFFCIFQFLKNLSLKKGLVIFNNDIFSLFGASSLYTIAQSK